MGLLVVKVTKPATANLEPRTLTGNSTMSFLLPWRVYHVTLQCRVRNPKDVSENDWILQSETAEERSALFTASNIVAQGVSARIIGPHILYYVIPGVLKNETDCRV